MHTSWIIWEKRKFLREQRKHSNLNAFLKIANRVNVLVDQCTFNVTRDWYGQWLVDTKMCAIKTIVRQTDMHFVRDSAKQVKKGRAHCPFFGPPYPFFGDPALFIWICCCHSSCFLINVEHVFFCIHAWEFVITGNVLSSLRFKERISHFLSFSLTLLKIFVQDNYYVKSTDYCE